MHNRVRTSTRPTPVVLLAIALALSLSGCPAPDDNDAYNFPDLAAIVASIDWAGDGVTRGQVDTMAGTDDYPLRASVSFSVEDWAEGQQALTDRMLAAGFTRVLDNRQSAVFEDDEWQVVVQRDGSDEDPEVKVFVNIAGSDASAVETLAPIARALGSVP